MILNLKESFDLSYFFTTQNETLSKGFFPVSKWILIQSLQFIKLTKAKNINVKLGLVFWKKLFKLKYVEFL